MKIGVVREGFGFAQSEEDVDAKVRTASDELRKLGAEVTEISIPMHLLGAAIWTPIASEGAQAQMMLGNGMGFNWKGLYTVSLLDAHAAWRERADNLSDTLKITMLVGQYFMTQYRGRFYAKAQNLVRRLKGAYDAALGTYDLLLMPTLPLKATPLPPADAPLGLVLQRAFEMLPNTAPFDVTGHPAMAIPCGMSDGLPISMMLVGKDYDEMSIYAAAAWTRRDGLRDAARPSPFGAAGDIADGSLEPFFRGARTGNAAREAVRSSFAATGTPFQSDIEVRYCNTACVLAGAGVGVAVVDPLSPRQGGSHRLVVRPFRPVTPAVSHVLWSESRSLSRLARVFLDEIRGTTRSLLKTAIA